MNSTIVEAVKEAFQEHFGQEPVLFNSPGRINLIGEHTDYNAGFVLPASVGQGIYFAVSPSGSDTGCSLVSLDFDERYDFDLSELKPLSQNSWQNYILGVVAEIQKAGKRVQGFNMVFSGDVPRGSGMSSSAALECGTCYALNTIFSLGFERVDMVKMSQLAEHNYAGVKCGIMDQFASMMGKADQVLLLDCQSLDYQYYPLQLEDYSLLLCNSNVSHNLASSEYNVRREQCESGVAVLQTKYPEIAFLRDASLEQLEEVKGDMDEVVYRRCKYVIEENERVISFTQALSNGDLTGAGNLLKVAQEGMRYEYEVTCPEIDFMADFANSRTDVLGARMMGGGFGGCTLNLIKKGSEDQFVEELSEAYQQKFNMQMTPIQVQLEDGSRKL
ncbi:galactokinase [Marinoscillum sp. MHG1-6]|uniref:galactokinase n=1 Tax=Marinoscillum sp. MHG1-6 TaxID=2959627 RepID=UPI00215738A0|nr:galactokinase [Marinoscillum sp. MHG1-6]